MNKHHRKTIAVLIALTVFVGFTPSATRSARAISNAPVGGGPSPELGSPDVRRFRIDAGQSTFMVHAFVGGLFSGLGHNHNIAIKDISGETEYTDDTVSPASLRMRIRGNSLVVTDKISDSDRQTIEKEMREQVLETGKYPEITFNSTKIEATKKSDAEYQAKIWGDLTLHGVTHNILINAELTFGDKTLRARGVFSLKMTDYSIKPPSSMGGGMTVKDTLKFDFSIFSH
jgi:polyisoprenoid-binding protein YceI